jgi:hypothetical protein
MMHRVEWRREKRALNGLGREVVQGEDGTISTKTLKIQ